MRSEEESVKVLKLGVRNEELGGKKKDSEARVRPERAA